MSGRGLGGWPAQPRPLRALLLLTAAAGATDLVRRLVVGPLRTLADLLGAGHDPATLPLGPLVAAGCAAALAACWVWLVACATLVAADALRAGPAGHPVRRVRGCPVLVRTLVLASLGVAVGTGPAWSDPGAGPGIAGLQLPDRVTATAAAPASLVPRRVRVRPGDTLWAIAVRELPGRTPDPAVARAWRRLAAANTDRLGDDPDLIFPGTVLRVPPLGSPDRPTRKEVS
jgi:hypothetical protein